MGTLIANIELLMLDILIVAMLFFFNLKYWRPNILNPLSAIYLLTMAGCVFESLAFFADGHTGLIWLNYLSNILYLGSISLVSGCMLEYCSQQFPKPIWKNLTMHTLFMLPLLAELILLISSPITGLVFSVDEAGFYHRESTFFLQFIPYGYLLVTTIFGVYWFTQSETTKERNQYLAISLFAIPPFLLGGIQLLVPENYLDILEFSVTLSLIANYAVSQNNRITTDTLTHLFNREMLDSTLASRIRRNSPDQLYVLMGDLDGFKNINDTFGHLEGDRALILAAETLSSVCAQYRATPARYGGDEFVVLVESSNPETPKQLIEEIEEHLDKASRNEKFALRMSIGCAISRPTDTVTDLIKAADKELYRIKDMRRSETASGKMSAVRE